MSESDAASVGAPKKRRKPRKRSSGPMVSEAALEELHATIAGVGLMVASLVPAEKRPLPEEVEGMLIPLERIYLRHMPETGVNPDVADGLIFCVAFAGWMQRIGGFRRMGERLGRLSRSSRPNRSTAPPRARPSTAEQGGYRTPEELMAQAVLAGQTTDEAAEAYERAQQRRENHPSPHHNDPPAWGVGSPAGAGIP